MDSFFFYPGTIYSKCDHKCLVNHKKTILWISFHKTNLYKWMLFCFHRPCDITSLIIYCLLNKSFIGSCALGHFPQSVCWSGLKPSIWFSVTSRLKCVPKKPTWRKEGRPLYCSRIISLVLYTHINASWCCCIVPYQGGGSFTLLLNHGLLYCMLPNVRKCRRGILAPAFRQ